MKNPYGVLPCIALFIGLVAWAAPLAISAAMFFLTLANSREPDDRLAGASEALKLATFIQWICFGALLAYTIDKADKAKSQADRLIQESEIRKRLRQNRKSVD